MKKKLKMKKKNKFKQILFVKPETETKSQNKEGCNDQMMRELEA